MKVKETYSRFKDHIYFDISRGGDLVIDEEVSIEPFVSIICWHHIHIHKGTQIASGARIVDFEHDFSKPELIREKGEGASVIIGRYCLIGANAVILKGVTLGDGCIVGAGAIVTKSFPAGSIIVGNPARLLRKR